MLTNRKKEREALYRIFTYEKDRREYLENVKNAYKDVIAFEQGENVTLNVTARKKELFNELFGINL